MQASPRRRALLVLVLAVIAGAVVGAVWSQRLLLRGLGVLILVGCPLSSVVLLRVARWERATRSQPRRRSAARELQGAAGGSPPQVGRMGP